MEKFVLQMLLFIFVVVNTSPAQNTLLAGKITNEKNDPVAGAIIKMVKGKDAIDAAADTDGLYYTKLLPAGKYQIRIFFNGQSYRAREINVPPSDKTKRFYNFKFTGNNAILNIDERDPFVEVALKKIDANEPAYDFPANRRESRIKYKGLMIDGNGLWRINDSTFSVKSVK